MYIKPVETVYNGYRFRSRLEARWAVLFDCLGIRYQYEYQGFDLGKLGYYLPDFYLPDSMWFVEVKGNPNDETGIEKARYLDDNPPEHALGCLIVGDPKQIERGNCYGADYMAYKLITGVYEIDVAQYNKAVTIAKQARFEHGETPRIERPYTKLRYTMPNEAKKLMQIKPIKKITCKGCGNKTFHFEVRRSGPGHRIKSYCNYCNYDYDLNKYEIRYVKYKFHEKFNHDLDMEEALIK